MISPSGICLVNDSDPNTQPSQLETTTGHLVYLLTDEPILWLFGIDKSSCRLQVATGGRVWLLHRDVGSADTDWTANSGVRSQIGPAVT